MSLVGNRSPRSYLMADMNQKLQGLKNPLHNPFICKDFPYTEPNLIDLDDHVDLEATSVDPKDFQSKIGFIKKWVAKEEAKCISLEKEKEQATLDAIVERDNLLRRMVSLKE